MNHSLKALIGLVTTGTAVAGAFLANNLLNKGQKKKEEPKSEPVKIDWPKKNRSRVSALNAVFEKADENVRREMANIISGETRDNDPRFAIDPSTGRFYGFGDVSTALSAWCSGDREDEKEKLEKRPELKKTDICEPR